jgi:hypothetical protein
MKAYQPIALLLAASLAGAALAEEGEEHEGGRHNLVAVTNAKWKAECASCHTLYHPGLLPERSWRKLMAGLDKHFGESAALDPVTNKEITDFLVKYSADQSADRRSSRIASSIPAASTPLRITETAWFKREHGKVSTNVWKRPKIGSPANCAACHAGAEQGNFSEHQVKIPR